jgi:hypothetical protein
VVVYAGVVAVAVTAADGVAVAPVVVAGSSVRMRTDNKAMIRTGEVMRVPFLWRAKYFAFIA